MYSVKSAYQLLANEFQQAQACWSNPDTGKRLWNGIWKLKVPNKVRHFMWCEYLSCYPLISISVLDTFYLIVVAPCVRITLKMCCTACGCVTMPSVFGYRIRPSPCYVEGCLGVLVIWCLLFLPKHPLTLLLCSLWSPGVSRPVATNCM